MNHQLAAQQRQLAAAIVGDGAVLGMTTAARPGSSLDAEARVHIYRHAYRARLTEALRSNYPVLHRVLGDDAFSELALAYLRARPSVRPSIRWFGDSLVEFMLGAPDSIPHPSLIDLARMEWALGLSFDSADAPVLVPDELIAVPGEHWPALRFETHPSVTLLQLEWSIEPVWRALTADENAEADAPEHSRHALLIWRQHLDTRWRSLDASEAALLRSCMGGAAFADLCEEAIGFASDAPAALAAGALRHWVEDGLLSQARLPG